jgi:cyclohexyl-isocyanide hydratase
MKIVMLAYPGMTPLDLMGPLQVFSYWPGAEVELVWKTLDSVSTDTAACIVPTHTFANADTNPDIIFVPGGTKATFDLMSDQETLSFLNSRAENAEWITSVCTGALILGAAGLLEGYKATTHWAAVDALQGFGAIHTAGRYVIDRNRATGGGVTAGIDFGLAMVATISGDDTAKQIQLALEYSPAPPFAHGTPAEADPEILEQVVAGFTSSLA